MAGQAAVGSSSMMARAAAEVAGELAGEASGAAEVRGHDVCHSLPVAVQLAQRRCGCYLLCLLHINRVPGGC